MRLSNNKAAIQWSIAVAFLLFVASMSFVSARATGTAAYSPAIVWGVLAVCWAASLLLLAFAFRQACVLVEVMPDAAIAVTWRHPFSRRTRIVQRAEIISACVVELRDLEGGLYYHARLTLADGQTIDLAEAKRRQVCASICDRFNAAVRMAGRQNGDAAARMSA